MRAAALFFLVLVLLLGPPSTLAVEGHWRRPPPAPMCASQITLVNHACSFLMLNPRSPPPSALPHHPVQRHHLPHHHHHHPPPHHVRRHSPEEEICCRWLKEVDDQCVCDMLVNLPPFLARPLHQFTVRVGDSCHQTYRCGTPITMD
ncbi:hypothetical protein DM860_015714 [Cuscuta australis]|uniref:Bifunctional inhibitor/plant lipid transfer protein/seed storage helical domain-containing protein n=1 Tax=Cuscuta australis TaxID=267555 RepID=A0A328DQH3_9ASTE|nr:hypothetical protein DM860_015714 [Cuscuta australis]